MSRSERDYQDRNGKNEGVQTEHRDPSPAEIVREPSRKGQQGWSGDEDRNDTRRKQDITPDQDAFPREGDRRDTAADQRPGFDVRFRQNYRPDSRGWSRSAMEEN